MGKELMNIPKTPDVRLESLKGHAELSKHLKDNFGIKTNKSVHGENFENYAQAMNEVAKMYTAHPELKGTITDIKASANESGARFSGSTLYIGKMGNYNAGDVAGAMGAVMEKYVADHANKLLRQGSSSSKLMSSGVIRNAVVQNALSEVKLNKWYGGNYKNVSNQKIARSISPEARILFAKKGSATSSRVIAEAYKAVAKNGTNASPFAKAVVNSMEKFAKTNTDNRRKSK